jgi:hypothetical protein
MQVMKAIANYDLEAEVVGLSVDNTNTNLEACSEEAKKMC